MAYVLSARSRAKLEPVHPHLRRVVELAITTTVVDFSVVEGIRTLATQRRYFNLGKSRTMNSRHLTGHAVDLAPWLNGTIDWENEFGFQSVAHAMKSSAHALNIPLEWGFDLWKWDMPHFQLKREAYP
jgi:peptidoglycan LD-endopeptidase CwlK